MFKNFSKKFLVILFLSMSVILSLSFNAEETPYFDLIIEQETTKELYGIKHTEIVGRVRLGSRTTKQVINISEANLIENPNLHAVSGDNYIPHGFGTGNVRGQAYVLNQQYQHQAKVISAVNADFFIIRHDDSNRLGVPIGAYVKDYRTIYEGDKGRPLIGIHDDGRVTIARPEFKGYEVLVFDNVGSKKNKEVKVSGFNRLPENDEVTAFFWNHEDTITSPEPKMVFKGIDVKTVTGDIDRYFAEGKLDYITTEDVTLKYGEFLLMGEDIFTENLITEEDTVVVQNELVGEHKGIRSGVAGGQILIKDGEIIHSENADVHPRTMVGVKEDGTLLLVTIDGRREIDGIAGMDYEQMSYLMEYLGAFNAINVDGGGSTTMLFYDEEEDYLETMNTPSDNPHSLRSVANGIFFLYGNLEVPFPPSPFPDTRPVLANPYFNYFDHKSYTLNFDEVENADYYKIIVNGRDKYIAETNSFELDLEYGNYQVEIQAFGDFDNYKQSSIVEFELAVFTNGVLKLIEGLKKYGQKAN